MTNFEIAITAKVKKCDNVYIGTVKELPIIVQADSMNKLKENVSGALAVYIQHHQDEFAESIQVKAAA